MTRENYKTTKQTIRGVIPKPIGRQASPLNNRFAMLRLHVQLRKFKTA
jgi:hypothetical protein